MTLLQENLERLFEKKKAAITPFQKRAWERFQLYGLPSRKTPNYKYLPLRPFYEKKSTFLEDPDLHFHVEPYLYPELKNSFATFVDGIFCPHLSSVNAAGLSLLPMSEAKKQFHTLFHNLETKVLQSKKSPFVLLSYCFANEGASLFIAPRKKASLQVLFITTQENAFVFPRLTIFGGRSSSLNLSITQYGYPGSTTNSLIDLGIEPEAEVNLNIVEQNDEKSSHLCSLHATLKEHSLLKSVAVSSGGLLSRHDYQIALEGQGAESSISGAWVLEGGRQHHVNALIHHKAPHTSSMQKFKGVLKDLSRSSFEGKIYVDPIAQKTQAYQVNHNLVLSEKAHAYALPNLEIFADDVKASHGATIGQINEEQLFYFKSRGIPEAAAKHLLVQGFTDEVLLQMPLFCKNHAYDVLHTT